MQKMSTGHEMELDMGNSNSRDLKYIKLTQDLKQLIFSEEIQPGSQLPSENELALKYQISRHTVRKALSILESEGYIYAKHGRGTFCSDLVRQSKSTRNIGVVTTYLTDYIFPRVIQGIDQVLTDRGYSIFLKNTRNSKQAEAKCIEELLQKDIDGMIIEPSKSEIFCQHLALYKKLDEHKIPYVFIQGYYEQMKEKPRVIMDDCKGGHLITRHLLQTGHKNIIGVFKADDVQGHERHRGYVQALQEAGILYDPDMVIWFHTEDRAIKPFRALTEMIGKNKSFDSVVCYNDQIAVEIVKALEESGMKVPEDVSVTGYDNSFIAENYKVRLTTVAHRQEELGRLAAELLVKLIQEPENQDVERQIIIEPELIIRESCRARSHEISF